jgi:glycosyltransferase involved in cell wall biosynthesis
MTIVFFTHRFLPDVGGVELTTARLAETLAATGHRMVIVTESASEQCAPAGVTVLRMRVRAAWPFTRLRYWRWMWQHRALFREADVLHFHDYGTFMHWFLPLRWAVRGPVYAMTFHGFDSWPVRRRDNLLRALAASCMDVTFGCGRFIARHYRQRIDHFYVGAPVRRPVSPPGPITASFLYIGRIADDTGVLAFTECLAIAAGRAGFQPVLTIVGDGPLYGAVLRAAGTAVTVHVHPATTDVASFLAQTGYVVGTGFLALFDAFAFERPVVVPAFTSIKRDYFASIDRIADLVLLARDRDELAAVLTGILETPVSDAVTDRVRNAKAYVDTLSWEGIAQLYVQGYERNAA